MNGYCSNLFFLLSSYLLILSAMKLIFATHNQHKADEIRHVIGSSYKLLTLKEAGIDIDIPEPYDTLEKNASAKSMTIYQMTHTNCFSEDTGLEVIALKGEPGVKSARYAGEEKSFDRNIEKLLFNLKDENDTSARFRTVISLVIDGREFLFEGACAGHIIREKRGYQGFGYDPVFIPDGSDKTFAEMSLGEKSQFSHRKIATEKLVTFLNNLEPKSKS